MTTADQLNLDKSIGGYNVTQVQNKQASIPDYGGINDGDTVHLRKGKYDFTVTNVERSPDGYTGRLDYIDPLGGISWVIEDRELKRGDAFTFTEAHVFRCVRA
ncbi:hypothetical protein [Ferrimonas balearica]|uniref:hypothetical protein n=1 Tax=Ferrimonas balearica TaxID=44012 RepID=UPI001C9935D8|nr:hypothetical protein [Ferrimonas balearica]MBY5920939.1 hypothetical protein [Ferrimonas balearica]MBY5996376.1 hypothetical protein [Ferrimonas balearica]